MGPNLDLTRRVVSAAAIAFAGIAAAASAQPAPLTNLRAISQLTNAEAARGLPVDFDAVVTYFRPYPKNMFVQDGAYGLFVKATTAAHLAPGDRVEIKGATHAGYRPYVMSSDFTLLGHAALPTPVRAVYNDLLGPRYDSTLVTIRGVVRAANVDAPSAAHPPGATFKMLSDGGILDVELDSGDASAMAHLLDAEVQVTGAAGARLDGKMQKIGILLHVPGLAGVKILKPATVSPWSLPATPMDEILSVQRVNDRSRRVRVSGVVTYYEPGTAAVLQNGTRSLWIATHTFQPLRVGDQAEAIGFPAVNDGFQELAESEIKDSGVAAPVKPQAVTWEQLASSQHIFDLVSIEGRVEAAVREAALDDYVLVAGGYEFSAIYRHPATTGPASPAPMEMAPVGSRIRVTGICLVDNANPFGHNVPFRILLRSSDDIAVVAQPPWMNLSHLMELAGWLLFIAMTVGLRGWYLDYKNHRQVVALAYVEQRRSRILEDINHSKPLAGILERITELVSVRLNGAACWCQVADGATLGNCPRQLADTALRAVEYPIQARSGPPLGTLFAAFAANTAPRAEETEAMTMAAELATLAIETSRLHSDLVHRSEFDLLTDVQNRFAMEKTLHDMIRSARNSAGIFALVYIDLNDFKLVNDEHGHQAGDFYLQEVAQRMKNQLRPCDTLARLGGDEFAVLVSEVRNRAEVEEIATRLESCFGDPFIGEGFQVLGSASVGVAIYPEDASTADSLLSAADAAMYVAKHTRSGRVRASELRFGR